MPKKNKKKSIIENKNYLNKKKTRQEEIKNKEEEKINNIN